MKKGMATETIMWIILTAVLAGVIGYVIVTRILTLGS